MVKIDTSAILKKFGASKNILGEIFSTNLMEIRTKSSAYQKIC